MEKNSVDRLSVRYITASGITDIALKLKPIVERLTGKTVGVSDSKSESSSYLYVYDSDKGDLKIRISDHSPAYRYDIGFSYPLFFMYNDVSGFTRFILKHLKPILKAWLDSSVNTEFFSLHQKTHNFVFGKQVKKVQPTKMVLSLTHKIKGEPLKMKKWVLKSPFLQSYKKNSARYKSWRVSDISLFIGSKLFSGYGLNYGSRGPIIGISGPSHEGKLLLEIKNRDREYIIQV